WGFRERNRPSRGGSEEASRHSAEHRNSQPFHYPKVASWTRIRTGAAAACARASCYCVLTFGWTAKWKAPGTTALSRCHGLPLLRFCTTTPRTPRTTPLSMTLVPATTFGFGTGAWSERTPTLNHVDRSASADAVVAPETEDACCVPPESDMTLSVFTRRDALRLTVASTTRPTTPSASPSV